MRLAKLLIGVLVALGSSATVALAAMPRFRPYWGVTIQAVYDQHGDPVLVANFSPNGGLAKPRWSICAPPHPSACRLAAGSSQQLSPGATTVGTVFKATATYKGKSYAATTAVWDGRLHPIQPPKLRGQPRVGARVSVTAATWRGGWRVGASYRPRPDGAQSGGRAPATDELTIEACRTRLATHCVGLTPPAWAGTNFVHPIRIEERFKGWYLFGFDQHFSGDEVFAASVTPPRPLKVGPTVARSEPYGPVR